MTSPRARRLIVNADDFGRSREINQAVLLAHEKGILTSASLMVNEPAAADAVEIARRHPRLGVGLHLTLAAGCSALPPARLPGLVDRQGSFSPNPVRAGWRYFAHPRLQEELRAEIHAQFDKFRSTHLPLDHVNAHCNLHLHPVIFRILMTEASTLGLHHFRLTADPFWLNTRLAAGRWLYRIGHGLIFSALCASARPALRKGRIKHTRAVFGLLQNGAVDETYLARLLPALPAGDSELYSHPGLDQFRTELDALLSPRIKTLVAQLGIRLIR